MEFVYVVKRSDLFPLHMPQGFLGMREHGDEIRGYLERARERGFFVERRHAEQDSSLKQLIPYTLVLRERGAGGGDVEVLLLQRSKKGGDARLHDKRSIGVGGHVEPVDSECDDLLSACALREIDEELELSQPAAPHPAGIINDDSNAVGSVHFGVVHVARLQADERVAVRETHLLQARFVGLDELAGLAADPAANLETWSLLVARSIGALLDAR